MANASKTDAETASTAVAEPVSEVVEEAWRAADTAAPEPALDVATERSTNLVIDLRQLGRSDAGITEELERFGVSL